MKDAHKCPRCDYNLNAEDEQRQRCPNCRYDWHNNISLGTNHYDILCLHLQGLSFVAKDRKQAHKMAEEAINTLNELLSKQRLIGTSGPLKIDDYKVEKAG